MDRHHKPELTDKNVHSALPALQALVRALAIQMARQDWAKSADDHNGLTDGTDGGNGATHRDQDTGHPSAISFASSDLHVPATSPLGDAGQTHDRRRTRR